MLVEVLSPGNEAETRANVWAYTTIPSVREVLLLRSSRIEAELLRRDAGGNWPPEARVIGSTGRLELSSIEFAAPLADFYRTTGLT
jgi:Uma2 family endonuclease